MESEQIFSDGEQSNPEKDSSSAPPCPPRPKLPFWLWLIIIIVVAAMAIIVVFWVVDIGGFGDEEQVEDITPVLTVTPSPTIENSEIFITNPKVGDSIVSPITVTGRAKSFENTVIIRIKDGKNNILAQEYVTADTKDFDARGNFSKEIEFSLPTMAKGYIEAYAESPVAGSEANLFSVEVSFTDWSETAEVGSTNVVFTDDAGKDLKMYRSSDQSVEDYGRIVDHDYGTPTAVKSDTAYVLAGDKEGTEAVLKSISLESGEEEELTTFDPQGYDRVIPGAIVVSPLSDSVAVTIGYISNDFRQGESPALFKTYAYSQSSGEISEIYVKESTGVYFVSEATDWTRANEVFVYEFVADAMAAAYGETVKIGVESRIAQNLYVDYGISGMSEVSPAGREVAFVEVNTEEVGGTGTIVVLNLETGEKKNVYDGSSSDRGEFSIIEIGDFTWISDGQSIAWGTNEGQIRILNLETESVASIDLGEEGTITEVVPAPMNKLILDFIPENGGGSRIIEVDLANSETAVLYSSNDYVDIIGTN